ncbi:MAG: diguanylate cyclase [Paracoccaceae bacterium]
MAGKILIVDDVATNRIVLKVKLASAYYETLQAASGAEAVALARTEAPDLVLLDVDLPDCGGIDVCRTLKSSPATRDIPVLMISAVNDPARRIEALRAGAEDLFSKPVDELLLLARLRSLLRAGTGPDQLGLPEGSYGELGFAEPHQPFRGAGLIGLVGGRVETSLAWKRALQPHLNDRLLVLDRDAALSDLKDGEVPDLFLVAADLVRPGDGLRFMSELLSRPNTRHSAVCLALSGRGRDLSATALDLGASDLVDMTADPAEAALRLQGQLARKRQADLMRTSVADGLRLAMIDPLTGLHNRRYGLPCMERIAERAAGSDRPFAVLLIDLDRFKLVNDTWGHAAGDAVLAEVACRLRQELRGCDLLARIGGEEFLAALPDTGFDAAHAIAERLRHAVGDRPVKVAGGTSVQVTLSIGLAVGGPASGCPDGPEGLMARADRALLAAKAQGRNRVRLDRSAA